MKRRYFLSRKDAETLLFDLCTCGIRAAIKEIGPIYRVEWK